MDPKQRRSRHDAFEPLPEQRLDGADAQWADREVCDALGGKRELEFRTALAVALSAGEQDVQRQGHSPQGKGERVRRGAVEPLHVVHGQEERLLRGKQLERGSYGNAQGARIDGLLRLCHEECTLERMPSGEWQRG